MPFSKETSCSRSRSLPFEVTEELPSGPRNQFDLMLRRLASPSARALRVWALLVAVLISVGILVFRQQLAGLATYGYIGLFLVNLFASATLFLPVPGLALTFAAGSSLSPLLVGLASGTGAALGEITGYLAGFSGQGLLESQPGYARVQGWMGRHGLWVVFVLSVLPNPFFDAAGMIAGAMRISVWRFLFASWAGKVIKSTVVAFAGAGTFNLMGPAFQGWLAR